jgi:pyruvate formate lyase activating enzyme
MAGWITDIQSFSTHDGPGIRTTVFFKGCPLHCAWCANPETIRPEPELYFRKGKCKSCGRCVPTCEAAAISLTEEILIDRSKCDCCFQCTAACLNGALAKVGRKIESKALIETFMKDRPFYGADGGVTFSGGEPLLQQEFLLEVLEESKKNGLHIVLDTCGYAERDYVEHIVDLIDVTLLDIKHMDDDRHKAATGVSNKCILENAEIFSKYTMTRISLILVPGFNDDDTNLNRTADFASRIGVQNIDLNLLHNFGEQKYRYLGKASPYCLYSCAFSEETVSRAVELFKQYEIETTIGRNY